jgi:iron complex transport system permease protein
VSTLAGGVASGRRAVGATRALPLLAGAAALLALSALFAISRGAVPIPPEVLLDMLGQRLGLASGASWPAGYERIVFEIRAPRVVLAGLAGAALAASGAAYQGLFRNPLADPYLAGVASGAGLGATIALLLPLPGAAALTPLFAFAGALTAVGLAFALARSGRTIPVPTLLLAGVAISSLGVSLTSFLMASAGEELRSVLSWLMGSFTLSSWDRVAGVLPYLAVSIGGLALLSRPLNVLQVGEEEARQLGLDTERVKLLLIGCASLATAAAVSVSGLIGFVGLLVPHTARLWGGPDYRTLLPVSAVAGAAFLILADTAARTLLAPAELPVGVVTACAGAPFFLYLLRTRQRGAL